VGEAVILLLRGSNASFLPNGRDLSLERRFNQGIMREIVSVLTAVTTIAAAGPALAVPMPAVTFTGGIAASSGEDTTAGFKFRVNSPILVSALGFFDLGSNGLFDSHQIGIFTDTGTLLSFGTVPAGATSPLINQFRYVSVDGIELVPGVYAIGAFFSGEEAPNDPALLLALDFATDPNITFLGAAQSKGAFAAPTESIADFDPAVFGPNFLSTPVPEDGTAVPEGGSGLSLLCAGLGSLICFGRRPE
jgi:hypothetical protein